MDGTHFIKIVNKEVQEKVKEEEEFKEIKAEEKEKDKEPIATPRVVEVCGSPFFKSSFFFNLFLLETGFGQARLWRNEVYN